MSPHDQSGRVIMCKVDGVTEEAVCEEQLCCVYDIQGSTRYVALRRFSSSMPSICAYMVIV